MRQLSDGNRIEADCKLPMSMSRLLRKIESVQKPIKFPNLYADAYGVYVLATLISRSMVNDRPGSRP